MVNYASSVYHYTKEDTAEAILSSMELRMRSFEHLNDPRESKTWPFAFYARSDVYFNPDLFRQASDFITRRTLIACCSGNAPTSAPGEPLRPGCAHPRMWAQYANDHTGVCLVFDSTELEACIRMAAGDFRLFVGPVQYHDALHAPSTQGGDPWAIAYLEDVISQGLPAVMEPHIERFHNALFFTKHIDWRDEWEQRWVVRANDDAPIFVPIRPALRAVLIGQDCSSALLQRIVEICSGTKISVHRIYWHGWAFSIFGNLLEPAEKNVISFNGMSYNVHTPCRQIYTQACGDQGGTRTIKIVSETGAVIPLD